MTSAPHSFNILTNSCHLDLPALLQGQLNLLQVEEKDYTTIYSKRPNI